MVFLTILKDEDIQQAPSVLASFFTSRHDFLHSLQKVIRVLKQFHSVHLKIFLESAHPRHLDEDTNTKERKINNKRRRGDSATMKQRNTMRNNSYQIWMKAAVQVRSLDEPWSFVSCVLGDGKLTNLLKSTVHGKSHDITSL
ncbi:hypothetical protein RRG08_019090 [Elysia crispata]|uniref:Uncharacterized protein n=1 Tax=Elysia crispata TaxID=231223 RepID=A0AAE1A5I8_9GAST|nr:hypothetical protein RRG08_019090 [Elysia crispata]